MQLNLATDNAIRAILLLAEHNGCLTGKEIACRLDVAPSYMKATLQRLHAAGVVHNQSGCLGGCRLNRPPNEISLYDIITAMEHTIKISRCLETGLSHPAVKTEPYLYPYYLEIQSMMEAKLKQTRISDIMNRSTLDPSLKSNYVPISFEKRVASCS